MNCFSCSTASGVATGELSTAADEELRCKSDEIDMCFMIAAAEVGGFREEKSLPIKSKALLLGATALVLNAPSI
jgi:hypothetical protein